MHWVCSTHLSLSSHIYVNVSVRRTSKASKLTVQFSEDRFGLSFNFNSSASFSSLSLRGRKVSYWKIYVSFVFVPGQALINTRGGGDLLQSFKIMDHIS